VEGTGVYFRIGLLIIGGIALLVALIWFLAGAQVSHGIIFESYFHESVQGLEVGAPVKYLGVTLGRVTDIGLVSAEYGTGTLTDIERQPFEQVYVRGIVDPRKIGNVPDTDTAVQMGLRARLGSQGITGLSYIELAFVNPQQYPAASVPWTPKAPHIPSMPSAFSQVQDAAQQVLAKLNRVDLDRLATQFTGLLSDLRSELSSGDLHDTLVEMKSLLQATNEALHQADLPGLSADLKRTSTAVRDTFQSQQTQKLLDNAALTAERLANAANRLPALISSAQATAQRIGNSTADIEQALIPILRDIQTTVTNLRELSQALRRNPGGVLFGNPPPRTEPVR